MQAALFTANTIDNSRNIIEVVPNLFFDFFTLSIIEHIIFLERVVAFLCSYVQELVDQLSGHLVFCLIASDVIVIGNHLRGHIGRSQQQTIGKVKISDPIIVVDHSFPYSLPVRFLHSIEVITDM